MWNQSILHRRACRPIPANGRFRLHTLLTILIAVAVAAAMSPAPKVYAQAEEPGRIQVITGNLKAGEVDSYLLSDLRTGDRLFIAMRATSGNLDPAVGLLNDTGPLAETVAQYRADIEIIATEGGDVALALNELREQYLLAWNDDVGDSYAALLEFAVPADGDYLLLAGGSLTALGRGTSGGYELLLGLNVADVPESPAQSVGAPIAELLRIDAGRAPSVEAKAGSITADRQEVILRLNEIEAGDTLYVYVEPTSGNLAPAIFLRDYGGKATAAANLGGESELALLTHTFAHDVADFSLAVVAAPGTDAGLTTGDFRALIGLNAPDVLSGAAETTGEPVVQAPIDVRAGIRINRISAVNSSDENYTVIAALRLDWQDPALAFSPDSCNCAVKLYTEKEFDRFLAEVGSRWPDFAFFNQLGNRWVQSRAAAIWPDGSARYAEEFSTTFQADFDFRQYPFDTQQFPIFLDMIYPADRYTLAELTGYSLIDPAHGEDEFIIEDFTLGFSTVDPVAADAPVSRLTFNFSAPRHLNYYVLQVFGPIVLIILISWFTFFLRDYTRRIEAAAANTLLFIAFSFSLSDNYPRLGYITFLDAIMAVTLLVNVLVLLYNVNMRRLENKGEAARVARVDSVFDWLYPLLYVGLVAIVALLIL